VTGGRTVLFKSMQDQDPPRLSVVEDVMFIVVNAKFDQSVGPVNKRVPHRWYTDSIVHYKSCIVCYENVIRLRLVLFPVVVAQP